ncbi:hypothetical protein RhiJN_26765 [Ceratobasidium sp. AG-Ba]|nr:hypothetical protein RhiJN_26765 [Ceratobasidium sp. AG-Ba]
MPSNADSTAHQNWADAVGLDLVARSNTHPVLEELKRQSSLVPRWLTDKESIECVRYRREPFGDTSEDPLLSEELAYAMSQILMLVYTNQKFKYIPMLEPSEADRRTPIDNLCSAVWTVYSGLEFVLRSECLLQVPKMPRGLYEIRPDVSIFIHLPLQVDEYGAAVSKACSSAACASEALPNFILHWVTEYKKAGSATAPLRQVPEGLVTGLYQRRALGFVDHFVFGMVHHSKYLVEVLAATWEPIDSVDSSGLANDQACPTASGSGDPNESDKIEASTSPDSWVSSTAPGSIGPAPVNNAERLPIPDDLDPEVKKVLEKRKIVFYVVAKWNVQFTEDVLALFLFMRTVQKLGLTYRRDIETNYKSRLDALTELAKDNYEWARPPPPRAPRSSGSQQGSSKRRRMDVNVPPTIGEQHNYCNGLPYSDLSSMFSSGEGEYDDSDESDWVQGSCK